MKEEKHIKNHSAPPPPPSGPKPRFIFDRETRTSKVIPVPERKNSKGK